MFGDRGVFLILALFLTLISAFGQERRRAAPAFGQLAAPAPPPISKPASQPYGLAAGVPTVATVTVAIPEAGLIPSSVLLLRLGDSGRVIATFGTMRDDGMKGDAVAGDKLFTLQLLFLELGGNVRLQASAAFSGSLKRRLSAPLVLSVQPSLTAINVNEDFAALNLGDRVLFWWPALPAQTAKITVSRATNQAGQFTPVFTLALSSSFYSAVDSVDGTVTDLYYRMDALSSTNVVLKSFATVKVPKYISPAQNNAQAPKISKMNSPAAPGTPYNDVFITDAKFAESTSMDVSQIWAFLNSFGGYLGPLDPSGLVQDDDGALFHPAGVIRDAAVSRSINPQLLLVIMQWEVLLINSGSLPPAPSDGYFHIPSCPSKQLRDQIPCLAQKLRSDFDALGTVGQTPAGWRVGVAHTVEDPSTVLPPPPGTVTLVTPANRAAAVLFSRQPVVGQNWAGGTPIVPGVSALVLLWRQMFSNMAFILKWQTCGACPGVPETTNSGVTIQMGVVGRAENGTQISGRHGVSAQLLPNSGYSVAIDVDLTTWDSYSPSIDSATGYWDSFSVTLTGSQYWLLPLSDPITAVFPGLFLWPDPVGDQGVIKYGDGKNSTFLAAPTLPLMANAAAANYLNVILDTATTPQADNLFPSWGSISVKSVVPDQPLNTDFVIVY